MMHCGLLRQTLINVLKNAGAKRYEVYRIPKDANAQPVGAPEKVYEVFGIYHDDIAKSGKLHIELAGVIIGQNEDPRIICIKCSNSEIKQGDIVHMGTRKLEILDYSENKGACVLRVREETI